MNCIGDKGKQKQANRLSGQVETLQEDLQRLSGYLANLAELSDEQLAALQLDSQMAAIHQCLRKFEARCREVRLDNSDEFADSVENDQLQFVDKTRPNWRSFRSETRRANRLANQLTSSLTRLHAGLWLVQGQTPVLQDITLLNQMVGNIVSDLDFKSGNKLG